MDTRMTTTKRWEPPAAYVRRMERETVRKLDLLDRLLACEVSMGRALSLALIPPSWEEGTSR